MGADSKPVATIVAFQLLDVPVEGILKCVEPVSYVAADFLW